MLDQTRDDITKATAETSKSADRASTVSFWATILFTLLALFVGIGSAYLTAKSISEPLTHLITVAREIGDSGDLDQNIDIHRQDEVGALATTFNNMVAYLKEMANVSMSVAEGDLTRIRHRPSWANGRPAATIELRAEDGTWIPHGIAVLDIEKGRIAGIEAFLDPALVTRFGVPVHRCVTPQRLL